MGSPPESNLDCKINDYSMLMNTSGGELPQTQRLREFLDHLEEERLKIDAFKRELPLCMQLLNNAVEASRKKLETQQSSNTETTPVLEEFINLKPSSIEQTQKTSVSSDKQTNCVTSAQLWNPENDGSNCKREKVLSLDETDQGFSITPRLSLDSKERNGGAFLPFSRERNARTNPPELVLTPASKDGDQVKKCSGLDKGMMNSSREQRSRAFGGEPAEKGKAMVDSVESQPMPQAQRKARRCWSPDLHRQFVNALQMLGGSLVATPKQIRELMKVDGLTNDEVKSHLQKYRLHTRRPGPTPPSLTPQTPHLVVLSGIWVPPEYAAAHGAIYGDKPAPAHYYGAPIAQEFYPLPPHHHPHYHPYNKASHSQSSPESNSREARERSESMEEMEDAGGRSDSGSWRDRGKGDRVVARGLLSLKDNRVDEGESEGCGINRKF